MKEKPCWYKDMPLTSPLEEIKLWYIVRVLESCDGNRTKTAEILGISLRGLRLYLHRLRNQGYEVMEPKRGV